MILEYHMCTEEVVLSILKMLKYRNRWHLKLEDLFNLIGVTSQATCLTTGAYGRDLGRVLGLW